MEKYKTLIIGIFFLIGFVSIANKAAEWYSSYQKHAADNPQEIVYNSSWDGSVRQVKDWMQDNLNDPSSVEYVEWSKVVKSPEGNFLVRCKYRANNVAGGKVMNNEVFFFTSQGKYIYHTPFQQ